MGKKMDALLGRGFKTSKFKATVGLAVSRLAVLKKQRQARCSVARSDVIEFLKTGNNERALLRVEQVMKEHNMLDVFVVLEGYCYLLMERVHSFQHEKVCPEELKEAVSTLIYASTRCGEFPELQEIRAIFASRFGKEFAARAVELRNNCGVNPRIIQKLSTRVPTLENKIKMLKEIASDNNIDLQIEENVSEENKDPVLEKQQQQQQPMTPSPHSIVLDTPIIHSEEIERVGVRRKYRDVADAAQAAFESAAYAAAAARAAVELSRSESTDPDDRSLRPRKVSTTYSDPNVIKRYLSSSSSDSFEGNVKGVEILVSSEEEGEMNQRDRVLFDESDVEDEQKGEMKMEKGRGDKSAEFEPLNINRRPISVRNRWAQGR